MLSCRSEKSTFIHIGYTLKGQGGIINESQFLKYGGKLSIPFVLRKLLILLNEYHEITVYFLKSYSTVFNFCTDISGSRYWGFFKHLFHILPTKREDWFSDPPDAGYVMDDVPQPPINDDHPHPIPYVVVIIPLTHKAVFLILPSRKRKFL